MFAQYFYHGLIRKYVSYFGSLFDNIYVKRTDTAGAPESIIKVPITYSKKEKFLARLIADPNTDRPASAILPHISFEFNFMRYDPDRKLKTISFLVQRNDFNGDVVRVLYNPVPYDIYFRACIHVKYTEDATQILEQILPYFTPSWTSTLELIPEMGIQLDIPVVLVDTDMFDTYDGDFMERRDLTYQLSFIVKGYFYGPVRDKAVIKFANTSLWLTSSIEPNTEVSWNSVRPGLDANGHPTSNASLTLSSNQIFVDSDYGFIYDSNNTIYIDNNFPHANVEHLIVLGYP